MLNKIICFNKKENELIEVSSFSNAFYLENKKDKKDVFNRELCLTKQALDFLKIVNYDLSKLNNLLVLEIGENNLIQYFNNGLIYKDLKTLNLVQYEPNLRHNHLNSLEFKLNLRAFKTDENEYIKTLGFLFNILNSFFNISSWYFSSKFIHEHKYLVNEAFKVAQKLGTKIDAIDIYFDEFNLRNEKHYLKEIELIKNSISKN
ncbi:hypothetical protein [Mycoplasmopsis agassizii]|uniref:Uncharacterized protein n=1 Tax=Mycoplasmopsis agassizii TaxID=33922 RepID=A0ABX4H6N8_9BACT|nr:hypothetical protein [Mycoplasmopsis agassizii]PAF55523.1 hypothetical protein CJF60_02490 [Mycoplasmopsis agassizii]SMC17976.1 hypothetical protein SAMN02745179_00573 [Mycoplasmopsis agassizii]